MNPLGIALAFVVFWAVIGLGLFLTFVAIGRLRQRATSPQALIVAESQGGFLRLVLSVAILLVGLAMMYVGGYATYVVIYR